VNINDLEKKSVNTRITLHGKAHVLRMNEKGRKEGRKGQKWKEGRNERTNEN
jgi:hypothetical protein